DERAIPRRVRSREPEPCCRRPARSDREPRRAALAFCHEHAADRARALLREATGANRPLRNDVPTAVTLGGVREPPPSFGHLTNFVSSFSTQLRTTAPTRREPAAQRAAPDGVSAELGFRLAAVQVGYWLGWASISVVLGGLALDVGIRHRTLLIVATLAAAAANTAAMVIPWRDWLGTRPGGLMLDLWCGGLIAFVATLVAGGGSSFSLLLFLAVPFIAVVQVGWRRGFWLATSVATCAVAAALLPLSAGATAMRLGLVAAAVAVALI